MNFLISILVLVAAITCVKGRSCPSWDSPDHGYKRCTNSNNERSFCFFRCQNGYKLQGYSRIRCNPKGYWAQRFPTCLKKKHCDVDLERPLNGQVSCKEFSTASFCVFNCNEGYVRRGTRYSLCYNKKWNRQAPTCEPLYSQCEATLKAPLNGAVHCDGRREGSACYFECNLGYVMEGSSTSVCSVTSFGAQWTETPPTCTPDEAFSCELLPEAPSHGFVECSDETNLGSICIYECQEGYELVGSSQSKCSVSGEESAEWDLHAPECIRKCRNMGNIEHGRKICFDSTDGRSQCNFECNRGFQLRPSFGSSLQCLDNGNWNATKPCCALSRKCGKSKKADIVIAIDASVSFGAENLRQAKDFARSFIDSFSTQKDMTRFSVFQYSNSVDTYSQALFSDLCNKDQMLQAINKMSDEPAYGTRTGAALNHVKNVILDKKNGDRPDVHNIVILFTGSSSSDDVVTPAELVRSQTGSTDLFVIGLVPQQGEINLVQMQLISRNSQNFFFSETGTELNTVDQILSRRINNRVCRVRC